MAESAGSALSPPPPAQTFHAECEAVLRAIRREPPRLSAPGGPRAKYRAILGEVEGLNRLLVATTAARDGAAEELREKLAHAEAALRERDCEIVRLRTEAAPHPCGTARVAQAALRWLRFLLERLAKGFSGARADRAAEFGEMLSELQRHVAPAASASCAAAYSPESAATGRALCARGGNAVVDFAEDVGEWRERAAALEAENAQLRRQLGAHAGEEVHQREQKQKEQQLRAAGWEWAEEQNAMLLAERDRQAVWIAELEQQLHEAQRERDELLQKLSKQAEAIHRHERVLDLLVGSERPE